MLHEAGFTVWSLTVRCFLIVSLLEKEKGKGGEVRLEKEREKDFRNQRDPCCLVWMQQWLRSEKRKGNREGAELCLSGCVVLCSLV